MKLFRIIVQRVMCMLMLVQIAMGILYIAKSFGTYQQFSEGIALIPFSAFIYPLQILAGLASTWYFLSVVYRRKTGVALDKRLGFLLTAFLNTIPFILQMHMALLSYSFGLSIFLVLMGLAFSEPKKVKDETEEKKRPKLWNSLMLRALVVFVCMFLLNEVVKPACEDAISVKTTGKKIERIQNSFGAAMVSRFVWPDFATNYYFWSDEVKAVMSLEDAVHICQREAAVENYFGPLMEKAYGEKEANRIYLQMAKRCFLDRTKAIVSEVARDFADYAMIPFTIEKNLKGEGTSLTAWNYGRMRACAPELVMYYFRYSLYILPVLLLGSILICYGKMSSEVKILVGTAVIYALWYTLRSNKPIDYKLGLPIIFIWYLLAVWGLMKQEEEKAKEQMI